MRLIDADHLKKWMLARWQERNPQTDRPFKAIEILDQIDREMTFEEQHWIPCSERLPEKSGLYLVTTPFDRLMPVHSRYFNERGEQSFWSGHPLNEVVAWMPLPEPYKGGQYANRQ